jgi:hypothetical protein
MAARRHRQIADWRGKLDAVDRPPRTVGRRS